MGDLDGIVFPCERLPEDPHAARLLGLYPQRQEGLWMQRVKVLGGLLGPQQWRALARIARDSAPATPLHLTTRQDVELHDLSAGQVPAVQQALADCGLTTVGACGDTLRNIMVCPCSGSLAGRVDLLPLAWEIRHTLEATEGLFALPRKFKISLSCGPGCGQPWINDLGLVARRQRGRWGFSVVAGGSLGARPGTAMPLVEWLEPSDVPALATAAVKLFAANGDREHRNRARLRHVRERVGDEAFAAMLLDALSAERSRRRDRPVELRETADGASASLTLTFANGDVSPAAAEALADLADRPATKVRLANQHRVVLFGHSDAELLHAAEDCHALRAAAKPQAAVVTCPGTRWCSRALVDTNEVAARIRQRLTGALRTGMTVCVSGCPNGCAHSRVADIGLTGCLATRNGERGPACDLFVGGGMGRNGALAELSARRLSSDEVVGRIAELLEAGAV